MNYLKSFGVDLKKGQHFEENAYTVALLYNVIELRVSSYLKPFGLSTGKFNILMAIKHQGGSKGISQVDISRHIIVTPSNMTRLLDKLQREKLIVRTTQENDRRINIITITEKGSKLLDSIWPGHIKQLQKLSDSLDQNQQKLLSGLLIKWLESIAK